MSEEVEYVSPVDKVVSEVNPFLTQVKDVLRPLQKASNLVARLGVRLPLDGTEDAAAKGCCGAVDEDGDLLVPRRGEGTKDTGILIEYENATCLSLVGLQVWRGAFVLGDLVVHLREEVFKGRTVLEVGAGTGLGSIVASHYASKVIATDVAEESILSLIKANVAHNSEFVKAEVVVRPLDFLDLTWSAELEELVRSADVILAADVVYHVEITNGFIETLRKLVGTTGKNKDVYIALEKRYLFTICDLETVTPMYTHFLDEMEARLGVKPGDAGLRLPGTSNVVISLGFVELDLIPQVFNYERTKDLVLLHLHATYVE